MVLSKAVVFSPPTFPFIVWVCGECIINWPDDLVHALNVGDAGVELGVDEEDAFDHLPVCFTAVGQHLVLVGWIEVQRLARRTHLYTENPMGNRSVPRRTKPQHHRFSGF